MKNIKLLQSIAGAGDPARTGDHTFGFAVGDEVKIDAFLADAWIASGIAEFVPAVKAKAEFAVAKKPETPEAPKAVVKPVAVVAPVAPVAPVVPAEVMKKEG